MGSNWEDEVILNDSQKPRRAKIPMRLDDPDKRYGTLPTPRPTLKILRTETQQENVSLIARRMNHVYLKKDALIQNC